MDIWAAYKTGVKSLIRSRDVVLDVGCGNGEHLKELLREDARFYAIDRNPTLVEKTRQLLNQFGVQVAEGDGETLNTWPDGSVDVLIGRKSVFRPNVAGRVLRPGGYFCYLGTGQQAYAELRSPAGFVGDRVTDGYYSETQVRQQMLSAGFNILDWHEEVGTATFADFEELATFWARGWIVPLHFQGHHVGLDALRKALQATKPISYTSHEWMVLARKEGAGSSGYKGISTLFSIVMG